MQLTTQDPGRRLWAVTDVLSEDRVRYVLDIDWLNAPWLRGEMQVSWPRRKIAWHASPEIAQASVYVNEAVIEIARALDIDYMMDGHWWLDEPGFTCPLHTDGHLPYSVQLYWHVPGPDWGTTFYHYKDVNTVKQKFSSITNTGYAMMNQPDSDGSQPLQWHAMLNPVPEGCWRLSSYWFFYK